MTARPMPPLPQLTATDPASIMSWASQLVAALERQIRVINTPVGNWAVTNVTANRTLNAGTATLVQAAEGLGTLITDLQSAGIIA